MAEETDQIQIRRNAYSLADHLIDAAGPNDGCLILAGIVLLAKSHTPTIRWIKDAIGELEKRRDEALNA